MDPRRRTPEEIKAAKERAKKTLKKKEVNNEKSSIKKASNVLFILAVLIPLPDFIYYASAEYIDPIIIGIDATIVAIFISLGIWSRKNPYPALITGLTVYLLLIALLALAEPSTIYAGIIWKVIIITALITGIKSAKNHKISKVVSNDILDA